MEIEDDPASRYVDYTNETNWERFIAAIEDVLIQWNLSDHGMIPLDIKEDMYKVIPFYRNNYLIRLHRDEILHTPVIQRKNGSKHFTPTLLSIADHSSDMISPPETIHRYFGCNSYIAMYRYNMIDLDEVDENPSMENALGIREEDIHILSSSLMVALGNCNCTIPCMLAIGHLEMQRYVGFAVPGTHSSISLQFDTAKTSNVPLSLHCVNGLVDLFRFKLKNATSASEKLDSFTTSVVYHYDWHIPPPNADSFPNEWRQIVDLNQRHHPLWKYMLWGPHIMPLVSLSLQTGWTGLKEGTYADNAVHSTLNPMHAPTFLLTALLRPVETISTPMANQLKLLWLNLKHARTLGCDVLVYDMATSQAPSPKKSPSRYQTRVPAARAAAVIGQAIGSLVSSTKDEIPTMIASLFAEEPLDGTDWCFAPTGLQHAVVVGQLVSRLALLMMNIEDISLQCLLWIEFVRALRDQWTTQQLLPHMGIGRDGMLNPTEVDPLDGISMPTPDFHFNLLHQKLQMLNLCIVRRVRLPLSRRQSLTEDDEDQFYDTIQDIAPVGVLEPMEGHYLLHHPSQPLYIPITQDPVPLTEDFAKEQQDILAKLGVSAESTLLRQQIQSTSMLSDMQAFKAANPQCCLADFIRWYSPRDWNHDTLVNEPIDMKRNFPQGHLSYRMCQEEEYNPWYSMWQQATPIPSEKQKKLFDSQNETEKIFHYFETLSPSNLIYHIMIATISNITVYWNKKEFWLHEYPIYQSTHDTFHEKCKKAIAALDDAAIESIKPTEEHQVLQALADDACEKLIDALATLETTTASLVGIRYHLPNVSPLLINDMVVTKAPVVVLKADREAVANVIWAQKNPNGPLHRFPDEREYVIRYEGQRPFDGAIVDDTPCTINRLYADFTSHEVRFASVLSETEF